MRHPTDNRVHVSELKMMSRSPHHYRLACEAARTVTRPMTVGAVADAMVFGDRGYAVYPGKVRNGKEWDAWHAAHAGLIQCIQSEYDDAAECASAVLTHPLAKRLLSGGEYQRTMQWEAYGLPMAAGIPGQRGGVDLINTWRGGTLHSESGELVLETGDVFLGDMKITASTEPGEFRRHAWKMLWHCQAAAYLDAPEVVAMGARRFLLIGCEAITGAVTVLPIGDDALESGRRSLTRWAERLRQCEASGQWPGYTELAADSLTVPEWEQFAEDVE